MAEPTFTEVGARLGKGVSGLIEELVTKPRQEKEKKINEKLATVMKFGTQGQRFGEIFNEEEQDVLLRNKPSIVKLLFRAPKDQELFKEFTKTPTLASMTIPGFPAEKTPLLETKKTQKELTGEREFIGREGENYTKEMAIDLVDDVSPKFADIIRKSDQRFWNKKAIDSFVDRKIRVLAEERKTTTAKNLKEYRQKQIDIKKDTNTWREAIAKAAQKTKELLAQIKELTATGKALDKKTAERARILRKWATTKNKDQNTATDFYNSWVNEKTAGGDPKLGEKLFVATEGNPIFDKIYDNTFGLLFPRKVVPKVEPKITPKNPYAAEYPDAYEVNGKWYVKRNGKTFEITEE